MYHKALNNKTVRHQLNSQNKVCSTYLSMDHPDYELVYIFF